MSRPRWYTLVLLAIILVVGLRIADPTAQTLIQGLASGCPSGSCSEGAQWQACDSTGKWYGCASVVDGVGLWTERPVGAYAPVGVRYVTAVDDLTLSGEMHLDVLTTGIVKVTTGSGELSTAVAADFPDGVYRTLGATHHGNVFGGDGDDATADTGTMVCANEKAGACIAVWVTAATVLTASACGTAQTTNFIVICK